ncbi:MAG: prepilin peptidase [Gammaproteobacteria bacterium]|nr:prepilin peptidase [Gammaproteobacteria bacterium]MAY02273.1 prepilin peptidase [Gammaproteobacteria bacterium]|tara:strand:+ start:106 stop:981 length:876 start_codon:yes stop_codon:yes gene_type:complete
MPFSEFFATYPVALYLFALALGLIIGSFLNVVIYRLPLMMQREWSEQCHDFLELDDKQGIEKYPDFNLARPGSHCPHCQHDISALENIPLVSFLIQGGKCKHCGARISARYPIIEAFTGILSVLVVWSFGFSWLSLAALLLTWSLICLSMIDFDHQLLPDDITLPLLWLGLLINYFGLLTTLESAFLGAVGGYMVLWCVYWLFKLLTGKEGMGQGDFKLLATLGAWLGWQALPQIILLSALVGAAVGITLIIVQGRDKNVPIPFGPYLAGAGFIAMLWGEQVNQIYNALLM